MTQALDLLLAMVVPRSAITEHADPAAWRAARFGSPQCGGSSVASILGTSPWGGQWRLWARLMGHSEPEPQTRAQAAGHAYERAILKSHALAEDYHVHPCSERPITIRHPQHPWAVCSIDGIATHDGESAWIVDAKHMQSPESYRSWPWKDSEAELPDCGELPPYYVVQGIWTQLILRALTQRPWGFAFVVKRHSETSHYLHPHLRTEQRLLAHVAGWWREHIELGASPEIDESTECGLHVARQYPPGQEPREATQEEEVLLREHADITQEMARWNRGGERDGRKREIQHIIAESAGSAKGLTVEGKTITITRTRKGKPTAPYFRTKSLWRIEG